MFYGNPEKLQEVVPWVKTKLVGLKIVLLGDTAATNRIYLVFRVFEAVYGLWGFQYIDLVAI